MHFRYARHTAKLESLIYFYTSIFEFKILGKFENHEGYNGVFLGFEDENWHLEFTENNEKPASKFDEDDILVFYPKSSGQYEKILENLQKFNVPIVEPKNPYWRSNGICLEDCDHHKVIVSHLKF